MKKYKYPHTPHAIESNSVTNDDKVLSGYEAFENCEVVVSLKLDGENTSFSKEYIHARSLDSNNHSSRNWVKGMWGEIKYNIPDNWRVCGENLYCVHSIFYDNLDSYFYCFNMWNENNECLSYDDTIEWCTLLGIMHVPVIWRGIFNKEYINKLYENLDKEKNEGLVIRKTNSFKYEDFKNNVYKIVRPSHVKENDGHWITKKVIPNKLKINVS